MATTTRHVITGGPGVGKTTTLELLASRGYATVRETARDIIAAQQEAGADGILPWTDNLGFQYLVLDTLLRREREACGDPVFCDRGAFDAFAYCKVFSTGVPDALEKIAKDRRYGKVFLLDQLPTYVQDAQRREDPLLAKRLHEEIGNAYANLGYEVVRVPAIGPQARVEYIIERSGVVYDIGMRDETRRRIA